MYHGTRRNAFTLIELLTVMAIITLLIGILTPALSTARDNAKKTAVRAQINAMEVGLEAFRGDEGEYVPSNAAYYASNRADPTDEMRDWEVGTPTKPLQGAHLLLDALVGRDFLGYDPKAPPFGPGGGTGTVYDRWAATNDRRQPYIPVDGVDVTSDDKRPTDAFGGNPTIEEVQPEITGDQGGPLLCRVFRDKFGWPVLYYRASPAANQNTPIITTTGVPAGSYYGDGAYDGLDNEFFTSYDYASGSGDVSGTHKIADAVDKLDTASYDDASTLSNRFAEFMRSLRATTYKPPPDDNLISWPRPVKFGRFLLLSAGKDGIYGNLDDVGNFNVLSEER